MAIVEICCYLSQLIGEWMPLPSNLLIFFILRMSSSLAKAMHSRIAGSEIPGKVAMEQPVKIPLAFLAMAAAPLLLVLLELTVVQSTWAPAILPNAV
jgi:hypothetical protein